MLLRFKSSQRLLRSNLRYYYTVDSDKIRNESSSSSSLTKQLYTKIKATGPITVADYMKEVLTNPSTGYYTKKQNVFGHGGDFITSPELTQMFGEMIAVWFLNEWTKFGTPKPIQLIELGPGNGSLIQDILRVFEHFNCLQHTNCINLVEISRLLSEKQANKLCLQQSIINDTNSLHYRDGISHYGIPIRWYYRLDDVPTGCFTLIVANEFFDALPIHKFERTDNGYREVLIDIDDNNNNNNNNNNRFRYVLSKQVTPLLKFLINKNEQRQHLEISPDSLIIMKQLTKRIEIDGGLCLIIDYGHYGDKTDTFRAFKQHQLHDPLIEPGIADLTADVDFARLKQTALEQSNGILTIGPTTQRDFLLKMGIQERCKILKQQHDNTNQEELIKQLEFNVNLLLDPNEMGERYKFFAIIPEVVRKIIEKYPVAGF